MKLKKWVALLLTGGLALGLTGCIGNFYENAINVDGMDLSSGMYLMLQLTAYNEAESKIETPEPDPEDEDASTPEVDVFKQTIEGKKAKDWIADRTEELCRRYVLVDRLCFEKGITLNEEGQSYIEQSMSYWQYLEDYYKENGISAETYQRYMANEALANQLFQNLYGEDGELATTDEEMQEEYAAKNAHIRFLSVPVNASDDENTDKTAEVEPVVATMLEALRGGKTLEDVAKGDLKTVYETLGREYNADTIADSITDSYIAYEQDDNETYSAEFLEELKNQAVGDFGSYNMGSTILLYEKIPAFDDGEAFTEMRDTVVTSLYSDAFDEYLASIYNNYTVTRPAGAQWYFRPTKIEV